MPKVALEHRYVPLIQKPKCCAAACLQMILHRRGVGLFDQETLAIELGVKVQRKDLKGFRSDMPIMHGFNCDEGISTVGSVRRINKILRDKRSGLRARAIRYQSIRSLEQLVVDALREDKDVWVEYHSQRVHPKRPLNVQIHDGLIESIDTGKGELVLIDPSPKRRQHKEIDVETMHEALSGKYGRPLGLLLVEAAT